MFTVIIERSEGLKNKDTYTLEPGENNSIISWEGEECNKKSGHTRKSISILDSKKINDAFSALNFSKIFQETDNKLGKDGWTLTCTLEYRMNQVSVDIWCPEEGNSKPETSKLLQACKLFINIFDQSTLDANGNLYVEPEAYLSEGANKILRSGCDSLVIED